MRVALAFDQSRDGCLLKLTADFHAPLPARLETALISQKKQMFQRLRTNISKLDRIELGFKKGRKVRTGLGLPRHVSVWVHALIYVKFGGERRTKHN